MAVQELTSRNLRDEAKTAIQDFIRQRLRLTKNWREATVASEIASEFHAKNRHLTRRQVKEVMESNFEAATADHKNKNVLKPLGDAKRGESYMLVPEVTAANTPEDFGNV